MLPLVIITANTLPLGWYEHYHCRHYRRTLRYWWLRCRLATYAMILLLLLIIRSFTLRLITIIRRRLALSLAFVTLQYAIPSFWSSHTPITAATLLSILPRQVIISLSPPHYTDVIIFSCFIAVVTRRHAMPLRHIYHCWLFRQASPILSFSHWSLSLSCHFAESLLISSFGH